MRMEQESALIIDGKVVSTLSPREQALLFPEIVLVAFGRESARVSGEVCVFGTDSASLAGDVMSDLADESFGFGIPMICDNRVPGWVCGSTTAIIVSQSGDAAAMEVYRELVSRGSTTMCITSDGPLGDACVRDGGCLVRIPEGLAPEAATAYALGAMLAMFSEACDRLQERVEVAIASLIEFRDGIAAEIGDMPEQLDGRVVSVYSTSDTHACAKRWKCLGGEDLTFYGEMPEFDHNELVGWSDPNAHARDLAILVLRGVNPSALVTDIVTCMIEVLRENGRQVHVLDIGGGSTLERNIRGIMLCDAISLARRCVG